VEKFNKFEKFYEIEAFLKHIGRFTEFHKIYHDLENSEKYHKNYNVFEEFLKNLKANLKNTQKIGTFRKHSENNSDFFKYLRKLRKFSELQKN